VTAAALRDIPCCLVAEVPRLAGGERERREADPTTAQRRAALTGAYLAGDTVAVGWLRPVAGGPTEVVVAGRSLVGPPSGSRGTNVNYPPGTSGRSIEDMVDRLERFGSWVSIPVVVAPLSPERRDREEAALRPSLEDAVGAVWPGPFGWLVLGTPIALDTIRREAADIARQIPLMRSQASNNQGSAARLERMEARHRELDRAEVSGLWATCVLAAGEDAEAASRVAALLCSSIDLDGLLYGFRPAEAHDSLESALAPRTAGEDGASWPLAAHTELLAALAFPPRAELPGVRMRVRPTFDVVPERAGDIVIGTIVTPSLTDGGPFSVSRETLKRHTFVCGATGSGKSQTVRSLLETLSTAAPAVPWLVIEPAKSEYARMAGRLSGTAEVIAIRPGAPDEVPAGLNPLEPEPGFPLQTHVDLVRALFLAAFRSEEPFPQILTTALTRSYEEQGWDLVLGEPRSADVSPRYPSLEDLQLTAREAVARAGYGVEVSKNVRGFVDVRLSSLRQGTPGRFLQGNHPLDVGSLLERNVVIELEDVGDDQDKAFLMGVVIIRVYERLRQLHEAAPAAHGELRHVTVIEEAHRLLRAPEGTTAVAHAVELFASLLAEVRAYGEGIVVAEQIPSKIIPDVIKNTAIKVIHRLPARDDREAVGATMNLTDAQSEYVVALEEGHAALFSDGMDYPALVRMELGEGREAIDGLSRDAPLRGRFSAACGGDCRKLGGACTLRRMRTAQRLLDDDAPIGIWAELVVLAHLVGVPSPAPGAELAADLRKLDRRTLDCALAHAVESAVAARSPVTSRHYSPAGLAAHTGAVLRCQLAGEPAPCADDVRWLAGPFLWNCLLLELERWRKSGERAPHPDAGAWASRYGVSLEAEGCEEQIAMVSARKLREAPRRRLLLFGSRRLEALDALESSRPEDRWRTPLSTDTEAFDFVAGWRWTDRFLAPEQPQSEAR